MIARAMVVNWKWLSVPPTAEGQDLEEASGIWEAGSPSDRVLCLNLPREEALFEEEEEACYSGPNERLRALAQGLLDRGVGVLLLLHRNAPHFYGAYDVAWFRAHCPGAAVALFGGGEDRVYGLGHRDGLLDQIGNFAPDAVADAAGRQLRAGAFEAVWEHYSVGWRAWLHSFSRAALPWMLAGKPAPGAVREQAAALLSEQASGPWTGFPQACQEALRRLASGEPPLPADAAALRDAADALVFGQEA
jgi:hypothetical protein